MNYSWVRSTVCALGLMFMLGTGTPAAADWTISDVYVDDHVHSEYLDPNITSGLAGTGYSFNNPGDAITVIASGAASGTNLTNDSFLAASAGIDVDVYRDYTSSSSSDSVINLWVWASATSQNTVTSSGDNVVYDGHVWISGGDIELFVGSGVGNDTDSEYIDVYPDTSVTIGPYHCNAGTGITVGGYGPFAGDFSDTARIEFHHL